MTAVIATLSDRRGGWASATPAERAVAFILVALMLGASGYLLPFWRESPELSHGYFAPLAAVALLWQSRREPNHASPWSRSWRNTVVGVVALCGFGVAVVAALAALAQGPLHSQTAFLAGQLVAIFTASTVLVLAAGPDPLVKVNGASAGAAALWWFSVPLPSGTLSRITLMLQDAITAGSLHAVHLFGIPATREGNIIHLATTLVGVEEACSGIRSLTACLFAGVVLGGLMLTGFPRRLLLVIAAGAIAVAANFVRSVSLCLMAAHDIRVQGFWHDATAFAVLGATAAILFAGCVALAPKDAPVLPRWPASPQQRHR
ncbi:MAG: hypothetical protein RIQ93_2038, partial [Verrucomicrobiota bacterium]